MVVKSATKKRLMDLGLHEAYAHLWANDIRMDELVQMNLEETMKHLYRHDVRLQELLVAFEPQVTIYPPPPYKAVEKLTYISFCRWGPASYPHTNTNLLRDKDETFINYISNFIEGVKVREGEWRVLHPLDGTKDVMMDRWGAKKNSRKIINWNTLPWGGEK